MNNQGTGLSWICTLEVKSEDQNYVQNFFDAFEQLSFNQNGQWNLELGIHEMTHYDKLNKWKSEEMPAKLRDLYQNIIIIKNESEEKSFIFYKLKNQDKYEIIQTPMEDSLFFEKSGVLSKTQKKIIKIKGQSYKFGDHVINIGEFKKGKKEFIILEIISLANQYMVQHLENKDFQQPFTNPYIGHILQYLFDDFYDVKQVQERLVMHSINQELYIQIQLSKNIWSDKHRYLQIIFAIKENLNDIRA